MIKNPFLIIVIFLNLTIIVNIQAQAQAYQGSDNNVSSYRLAAGDKIKIQVYGEDEMGLEAKLSDAGTLMHPLLGEITAKSFTIGELTNLITKELKGKYLVEPKVSVNIVEYREYFINGEVQKPGAYHYEPGLSVYKAISTAGGFTQRASRTGIYIISEKDGSQTPKEVSLDALVSPGDVLTIDESFF